MNFELVPQTPKLSDRAMQVKLVIRRATLVRRDNALTTSVQQQNNDTSLTVLTKLFRERNGPIFQIMQAVNEVYTYHTTNTLPYVDAGPRLLPSTGYFEYAQGMQHLMGVVDSLLQTHMPNYDALVLRDVAFRNGGQAVGRASVADYPSAAEFESKMKFDLKYMPLPDESHSLFDLSEDDKNSFKDHVKQVVSAANSDVIHRMLEPLGHLVDKLATPIGAEKSIFRDSAIENVLEGCRVARRLMIEDNPALRAEIDALERLMLGYSFGSSQLRESPDTRQAAADQLAAMAAKMKEHHET